MEVQFEKKGISCVKHLLRQVQTGEQTQELRLMDGMPDIGRVLGTWGQVILRGKEWRGDTISCNGGVMVWVLYAPEDGSEPKHLESWIPLQMRWNLDDGLREGQIRLQSILRSVDARSVSPRKIMLRCSVSVLAEAGREEMIMVSVPGEVPEDVQLLKHKYPMRLPREMGEKSFQLDEEITLPGTAPGMGSLIACTLDPRVNDIRITGDKLVCRGTGQVHTVYLSEEGSVFGCYSEFPFSQILQLEKQYGPDAQGDVRLFLTGLETETDPEGKIRMKCGMVAQFQTDDREVVEVVEDAYSIGRELECLQEEVRLPAILELKQFSIPVHQTLRQPSREVADLVYLPDFPVIYRGAETRLELPGMFQVLFYDENGILTSASARTEESWQGVCGEGAWMEATVLPGDLPVANSGSGTELKADTVLWTRCVRGDAIPMITGLRLGEQSEKPENRPSVILRRAGEDTLWEIAKSAGSTVRAIREANGLEAEPVCSQILLIPVS